jgi:hypothetical protein
LGWGGSTPGGRRRGQGIQGSEGGVVLIDEEEYGNKEKGEFENTSAASWQWGWGGRLFVYHRGW